MTLVKLFRTQFQEPSAYFVNGVIVGNLLHLRNS